MILLFEFLGDLPRSALWSIIVVLLFFSVFFWRMFAREKRRHESDTAAAVDLLRKLVNTEAQNGNLLMENKRLKEQCEQKLVVIEAAKEERLSLLEQQAEDANALSELREVRLSSARVIASMDQKIDELLRDVDARSKVMFQQVDLIEKYRQLNEALIASGQPRGEGGRFVKKAEAAKA